MVRYCQVSQQGGGLRDDRADGEPGARRRPLAAVARADSDGRTAAAGGLRDWTTKGSLAAEELDRALFGLPIGQLSPILESDTGYHIVRVIDRQEATRTSFPEAQDESARRSGRSGRRRGRRNTGQGARLYPPWTIFDAMPTEPAENRKARRHGRADQAGHRVLSLATRLAGEPTASYNHQHG